MSGYAAEHADALAEAREAGARIVFTRTTRTPDATTGQPGPSVTVTISGYAVGLSKGDPATYEKLGLTLSAAPSAMVVCDTYGDVPPDQAACEFGGKPHTVAAVAPFAPDGRAIYSTCVLERGGTA